MQPTPSFAPLAARLAAKVDEIRPADGAEVSWANFMALFWCAIFQMLIALCEALDARAAADARLPALAIRKAAAMPGRKLPVAARAPRLALVPEAQANLPMWGAVATARPEFAGPWLAWSRDPGVAWGTASPRIPAPSRKSAPHPGLKHVYFVAIS